MSDQNSHDTARDRVAETVRRALSLVGPSEHGVERIVEEIAVEDAAV